jgi:glycosyltransferase involved in cell wall biosynthesis
VTEIPGHRAGAPGVTVAVCTRNRGADVLTTLRSILANDVSDMELVVIDQSTDAVTETAVRSEVDDPRVRYIRTTTVGIGVSRRLAVESARSELVLFTDDDCTVPPDWVRQMVSAFDEHRDAAMVFCSVRPAPHDPTTGFVPAYERPGDHRISTMRDKCRGRGIGAGMAVRRTPTLAVGSFDAALGSLFPTIGDEEGDLAVRLVLNGHVVLETDRTFVVHAGFRTWEQGRDLTRRDFTGIGLVSVKPVRCGHPRAVLLVFYEGVVVALLQPLKELLRLRPPRGLRGFLYFWIGFARGLRTPIDCATISYAVRDPESLRRDVAPRNRTA